MIKRHLIHMKLNQKCHTNEPSSVRVCKFVIVLNSRQFIVFVHYKINKLCCDSIADKFLCNLAMINIA